MITLLLALLSGGDLVPVRPEDDGARWCKAKPVADPAVRSVEKPFAELQWGSKLTGQLGTPVETRALLLREKACKDGVIHRILAVEWTYADEAAATAAEKALVDFNHDSPELKRVHRIARDGKQLLFVQTQAGFQEWDWFDAQLKTAGLNGHSCKHR